MYKEQLKLFFLIKSHRNNLLFIFALLQFEKLKPEQALVFVSENVQVAAGVSSKCHRIKEKGTVPKLSKAKSLFVGWGLEKFPQKVFAQRKCPDNLSLYQ